ncbi:unnamed protein product [Tilletia caries]|nr:unnamed protein product [Tilletia caries]
MMYAQSILTEDPSHERIREACTWIQQALEDFRATQCLHRQGSALYYLARWHDVLGDVSQRDAFAGQLIERDAFAGQLIEVEAASASDLGPSGDIEHLQDEIIEVVSLVGANVAVGIPV